MTREKQEAMLEQLLSRRCSNYGYDWKAFKRISNQRCAARAKARQFIGRADELNWDYPTSTTRRIDWERMSYTVGQSENEEITNLLRQLVNPGAPWVA